MEEEGEIGNEARSRANASERLDLKQETDAHTGR